MSLIGTSLPSRVSAAMSAIEELDDVPSATPIRPISTHRGQQREEPTDFGLTA